MEPLLDQIVHDVYRAARIAQVAKLTNRGINLLGDWCERGVRVVSVTQQIDLSGSIGHLIATILFAVAEIELQNIKQRQAAGIAVAKQNGCFGFPGQQSIRRKKDGGKKHEGIGMEFYGASASGGRDLPSNNTSAGPLSKTTRRRIIVLLTCRDLDNTEGKCQ